MDGGIGTTTTEMTPHLAMQQYLLIRDARAELAKKDKAMKSVQDNITKALFAMASKQGVTGFKADDCVCFQKESKLYSVKDSTAFFSWVIGEGHVDALHKRVNSDFASAFMEQNEGALPPGIHLEKELKIHVRRSGEKD